MDVPGIFSSSSTTSDTASSSQSSTALESKDMFLRLFVAQLKNQDPMSPADGTQFVAQLAQFSELEQVMNIGQDLKDIKQAVIPSTDSSASN